MLGSTRGCRYADYLLRIEGGHVSITQQRGVAADALHGYFSLTIQTSRFLSHSHTKVRQGHQIVPQEVVKTKMLESQKPISILTDGGCILLLSRIPRGENKQGSEIRINSN